jgi:hypothetical protein
MNHIFKEAVADRQQNILNYYHSDLIVKGKLIDVIVDFIKNN